MSASKRKAPSLRDAFDAARPKVVENKPAEETGTETQARLYPGPRGKRVQADFPVSMSFTLTAKERYDLNLALTKRGITVTQFLRDLIAEMGESE